MTEIFSQPDDSGPARASEAETSLWGRLGGQAADTLDPRNSLSGMYIARRAREASAGGDDIAVGGGGELDVFSGQSLWEQQSVADARRAAIPDVSQSDARLLLKQEGLSESDVHLGDAPNHKLPVLKLRMDEAHTRRDREAAIARGPQGFFPGALGFVTSLGVGMIDPVNAAAFSIPVIGEARMGKIIASAGDSILARSAARAGQGAAQGAVGTAALQPADWWLHTKDGQDYTMAQAMESVIMGAGMGAAFHAAPGALRDWRARRQGMPLEGSPQDLLLRGLMTGTHVPAEALHEDGVALEDVPGIGPVTAPRAEPIEPPHPAQVLADLPAPVREDAIHAAIADIISDQPVRSAEMLDIAADHDPRIAESIEAWHGSPHDFDRFDLSRIGTGEGAQAYGHGLYFAENEKVARAYQRATSDKAFIDKVATLYDEGHSPDDAWAEIKDNWKDFNPAEQRLMTALEKDDWLGFDYPHQAVSAALRNIKNFDVSEETRAAARAIGSMYRVNIKANPEHFLDWDKPFSEQSEHVQRALREHPDQSVSGLTDKWGHDMAALYSRLSQRLGEHVDEHGERWGAQGPSVASRTLHEAGIPGIKYLDHGSRPIISAEAEIKSAREFIDRATPRLEEFKAGEGSPAHIAELESQIRKAQENIKRLSEPTRNFVVFNDKHIEITHKNGEPVSREELRQQHVEAAKPVNDNVQTRSSPAVAAADPRWRELAETKPDYLEPETLAESEAAEHLAEPDSLVPERSLTALERSAADAEEVWRKLEPTLTESERALVNDVMDQLQLDRQTREQIISDGAACLVAAVG